MKSATLLTSFILICSLGLRAQVQDANLWTSVGVNADLTKDLSLAYETQTRFYKNATTLDSYYNEFSASYDITKFMSGGLNYRYSRKNQEGYFEGVHRLAANISFDYKVSEISTRFKFRIQYQVPFNRFGVINNNIYPDTRNLVRFKISAKHKPTNLKLIQPYASYEIYKAIRPKNIYSTIDSYRITFGVSLDLPKRHSVDLYYLFERENRATPHNNHIYGIQYNYDLFKKPVFKKSGKA